MNNTRGHVKYAGGFMLCQVMSVLSLSLSPRNRPRDEYVFCSKGQFLLINHYILHFKIFTPAVPRSWASSMSSSTSSCWTGFSEASSGTWAGGGWGIDQSEAGICVMWSLTDQSEASIMVTWSLTNQEASMIPWSLADQSEASIWVKWSLTDQLETRMWVTCLLSGPCPPPSPRSSSSLMCSPRWQSAHGGRSGRAAESRWIVSYFIHVNPQWYSDQREIFFS